MTGRTIVSFTEVVIYLRQVEVLQRVELLHDLLPQLLPLGLVNHPDADVEGGVHRLVITDLTKKHYVNTSAVKRSIGSTTGCTITEKAPTRAF